jgi:serine O-acetyltransferase
MKNLINSLLLAISTLRLLPHLLLYVCMDSRGLAESDVLRWSTVLFQQTPEKTSARLVAFLRLMTSYPEFRNLFYKRMGLKAKLFSPLCKPMPTLFIATEHIGKGLFIQHGFVTIIAAARIGDNCWINQQVTIGYDSNGRCPAIGDDVVINAGAKVIGGIELGDHTKVGANAVVVKSTPPNVTVVGVPARIVKRDGRKVRHD